MRGLLQPTISRADAVFNIQRMALLVDSLHRGDLSYLVTAAQDKLHQVDNACVCVCMCTYLHSKLSLNFILSFFPPSLVSSSYIFSSSGSSNFVNFLLLFLLVLLLVLSPFAVKKPSPTWIP